MEVKCNVCGTINNSENKFCKGCFIPLHKTMQDWTKSIEDKVNEELENKVTDETTLLDAVDINVWENIPLEENEVKKTTPDNEVYETTELDPDKIEEEIIKTEEDVDKTTNVLDISPVDEIKVENSTDELDKTVHINTPIATKEVEDIKSGLSSVSFINDEEFDTDLKSAFALAFKFDLIFIILTGIFTYFYGIKIETNQDIVYGALATFIISGISTVLTFRRNYPSNKEVVQTLMIIFITIVLFECASRSILLYYAGINYLYYYIFVYVVYILISIVTVNAVNRFIRTNNKDYNSNFISKLNSFALFIVIVLLISGAWAKKTNYVVIEKTDNKTVSYEMPDQLIEYITNINNKIQENINNDENYKVPELITDKNFVETDLEIESISLAIDDYGTVSSGEIKYEGQTYRYKY